MKGKYFFLFGFSLVVLAFGFWQKDFLASLSLALQGGRQIISPISQQLVQNQSESGQILGEITTLEADYDFGQVRDINEVLSQGALVYDLTANKIIFKKDEFAHLQAASTVKIVTAAVALDRGKLDEEMTVNYFPTVVGESSMNLAFGEKFSLEELLYGLLLNSGNDAAETIAQGIAGKRETYVGWMNEFMQKLGAKNTNFTTPSGLDEDGQYTSAWDLFLAGKYIFGHYPTILEISTTKEKYLPKTDNHRAYLLRNKLLLLEEFPILGGKPGLGEQGMMSLVALLKVNKHQILAVFIRTPSMRHDLTQILKMF